MGFFESFWYLVVSWWFVPKTRDEVPFKQMGYDLDQFILFFVEIGLYNAALYEAYKGVVCVTDQEYGYSKGWCPEPEYLDEDAENKQKSQSDNSDKLFALMPYYLN